MIQVVDNEILAERDTGAAPVTRYAIKSDCPKEHLAVNCDSSVPEGQRMFTIDNNTVALGCELGAIPV